HNVFRALELARRDLGACVPALALQSLQPKGQRADSLLTLPDVFAAMQADHSEKTLRSWLRSQTWRQRLVSLWHILAPPPATMRRVYGVQNSLLVAALYLLRPFQIAGRLARVLWIDRD